MWSFVVSIAYAARKSIAEVDTGYPNHFLEVDNLDNWLKL